MLPDWFVTYIGGGLLIVITYVVVSNTFWLVLGSSFLTKLPGVNQEGAKGTIKIALLLILCLIGLFKWSFLLPVQLFSQNKTGKSLKSYISDSIRFASKVHQKAFNRRDKNK